jgi:hypothetical protein
MKMVATFHDRLLGGVTRERSQIFYQALALAPRLLLHCASAAALLGLTSGCVAETRYEEARSAGQVEMGARQLAEQRLQAAETRLAALEAELKTRDQKLSADEQAISQSELDSSVLGKERDQATQLVEQLRSELARVGGDLRTFSEQKESLEHALSAAEAKKKQLERADVETATLVRMTRDLSAVLGDGVLSGELALDIKDGVVVLRVPREKLFSEDKTVRSDSALGALARVLEHYPQSALSLSESGKSATGQSDLAAVSAALSQRGVAPARIQSVASSDGKATDTDAELEFALAPSSASSPDSSAPSAPQVSPSERAAL